MDSSERDHDDALHALMVILRNACNRTIDATEREIAANALKLLDVRKQLAPSVLKDLQGS